MQAPDRHELNAGQTLPYVYGLDRLVLLPQTPHRLFAYWEITPLLWKNMHDRYQDLWAAGQTVLRIINLDTGSLRQPAVDEKAGWYVSKVEADRTYRAELGRILADGTYLPFLVSIQSGHRVLPLLPPLIQSGGPLPSGSTVITAGYLAACLPPNFAALFKNHR